jgi:eukaryotic-like serine/threonine-protein kinase
MTPERWQKIEAVFHAAAELDVEARTAFVAEVCGNDLSLRHEVESLLSGRARSVGIMDATPLDRAALRLLAAEHEGSFVGRVIGRYRVLAQLGAGGMGEVYAAEDTELGRKVALKLLPAALVGNAEQASRLQREARAASALNHPNIITVHETGEADGLRFIAMEFIQGETLRRQMRGSHVPVRVALDIAVQIAGALAAAHKAGIIHRDIKPENVMARDDGYVKVLDFGIARLKDSQAATREDGTAARDVEASAFFGTASYMSPEQARGEPLDARTDLFSFGVLLYELLTGRRPFEGETLADVLRAVCEDEPQPLNVLRPNVPRALEEVVGKLLRKNRDERYQSADELLDDLKQEYLIEQVNQITGKALNTTQRADLLLRQYLMDYRLDERTRIPLSKLWLVSRHARAARDAPARELLRKSLRWGLIKAGALVTLLIVGGVIVAARLSVREEWDDVRLSDGHKAAVRRAVFSPDGRLLISAGEDAQIIVWDFARRQRLTTLAGHSAAVSALAFSPDGKWLVSGDENSTVIVWDAERWTKVTTLDGHSRIVGGLAFSPDGRLLASTSSDPPPGRTILWDVGNWQKLREWPVGGEYRALLFTPDGRQLMLSAPGITWELNTGRQIDDGFRDWSGNWAAISPDGSRLVGVGRGGSGDVSFSDLTLRKVLATYHVHQDNGRAGAYSPDGRFVASGADDIVLWDAATQTKLARFEYPAIVWSLTFSPDGRWLVSTHGDGAILMWDVAERRLAADFNEHGSAVRAVAFSRDGNVIASAGEDRSIILWDAVSGRKEAVLLGHDTRVTAVAFAPDGTWLASCDQNGYTDVWDVTRQQLRLTWGENGNSSYCLAISPDGRWLATTHGVYNSADGYLALDFNYSCATEYGLTFSTDGSRLAKVTDGGCLSILEVGTWRLLDQAELANTRLISVSFSPDGEWLVTGEDQGAVRLWSVNPLREVAVIGQHAARVKSVAFSPDGRQVASAGDDKVIALWDVRSRSIVTHIGTHTSPVLSVAFSPDGRHLVSGEHDRTVHVFTRRRTLWGYQLN